MVLDNADDIDQVDRFIPHHHHTGRTLLTTRAQDVHPMPMVVVDAMTEQESVSLLLKVARLDGDSLPEAELSAAHELARLVHGLPLALDIAGAYIAETRCGVRSYVECYRASAATMLDEPSWGGRYPHSIRATWRISIKAATSANAAAGELLRMCSLLHADSIPMAMTATGIGSHWESAGTEEMQRRRVDAAVQTLRRYSLVDRDGGRDALSMHRLVQVAVRSAMDSATRARWAWVVVAGVADYLDTMSSDEHYLDRQGVLPHTCDCASATSRSMASSTMGCLA
jgi:hypothetical protein